MSENNKKLLLIDGHSIASRAFYGIPLLTNSEGLHTNAIYGFLNILLNTYSQTQPDYVMVAFDMRAKTFRHELYTDYKGTRKGMPDELHEQIPVLEQVLNAMHIRTVKKEGYEADDILGTLASRAEAAGLDVVILSGDRDLLQLATEKTMIVIPKTKSYGNEIYKYYAADVVAEYQVTPDEFIDLKALMGDSSDNIPGVPGIGPKRATDIIVQYRNLENAIAHADEIKPAKTGMLLKEHQDLARLSKTLATIIKDAPIEFDYADSPISGEAEFFNPDSYELYKKLELKKLLERFDSNVISNSNITQLSYTKSAGAEVLSFLATASNPLGLFVDPAFCLVAVSDGDETYTAKIAENEKETLAAQLIEQLSSEKECFVFGAKNLLHTLNAQEFYSDHLHDMEILAYLIDPNRNEYTYDYISDVYLQKLLPSRSDLIKKVSFEEALEDNDLADAALEAASYSALTAQAAGPILQRKIAELEMDELYSSIEQPLVFSLYNMEKEGIAVDSKRLHEFSDKLQKMIEGYQTAIFEEAGCEFNLNSPKQLGEVLFERMKLPASKKTKSGYSTAADILEKLAPFYPVVRNILQYRQAAKLKSTYADGLPAFIASDGRIHGKFNQTVTATGRISSSDPNLQNIPTRTELGQEIRKAFVAKEGCVLLDADYSQIELRLLAHMSGDENLIEAYRSDEDIHRITASKVFHVPLSEVTKEQRRNAKAVNFGIVYGISSFGLSQDLSITRKEAESYIKQYFATYPKVKEFLDNTVKQAKINGYTTTMFSRRRPIPELKNSNAMIRSFGERAAMNAPIQGSAADIIKIAMINVDKKLKEKGLLSRIVLQVHDELIIEAPEAEKDAARAIITEEMKNAAFLKVALVVDCNEGHDWYESH